MVLVRDMNSFAMEEIDRNSDLWPSQMMSTSLFLENARHWKLKPKV